ncbi:MAG: glycoside hydrolase family 2 TIM barrel-domain containing protein [Victivallaceae bacterium]|nr:glycoside hydrolase family 2 TIM barrel-domain containing protein [Victivallaceae bacterium]
MRLFDTILFLCAALTLAAGESKVDSEGFVSEWLISGPYPSYVVENRDTGLTTDYLDGEASARPYPGLKRKVVFGIDEAKLIAALNATNEWGRREPLTIETKWQPMSFQTPSNILMNQVFAPIDDHFVFFACTYIQSPVEQEVKIGIGVDDEHKLYLNGAVVGEAATSQAVKPNTFVYRTKLKRGLNTLLLKVVDRKFDCGFCLTLTDPKGQPLRDLTLYTDSPARKLGADLYDNGFGFAADWNQKNFYDTDRPAFHITFFAPDKEKSYLVTLPDNQRKQMKHGDRVVIAPNLVRGRNQLTFSVSGHSGETYAKMSHEVTLHSRAELRKTLAGLQKRIQEVNAEAAATEKAIAAADRRLAIARKKLSDAQKTVEQNYQARHETMGKKVAVFAPVPLTMPAKPLRTQQLLNGIFQGRRTEENKARDVRLPLEMFGEFFRNRYYPVEPVNPKMKFARAWKFMPGYQKHSFDDIVHARKAVFETKFLIEDPTGRHYFICDNVIGKIRVLCNDVECGVYDGQVGIVEINLTNVKKGENQLKIEFEYTGTIGNNDSPNYGILGDLKHEQRGELTVSDLWIKPSYRNSTLTVSGEVCNLSKSEKVVTLRQYAVADGMVIFALPEGKISVPANGKQKFMHGRIWNSPKLWSPANPFCYTLVSDLFVDGKHVDRRSDTFGFREFWIHGVDFFLNGKRMILQGDVGIDVFGYPKARDVLFGLLREDHINTLRLHDAKCATIPAVAEEADRAGMLLIAQYYPAGDLGRTMNSKLFTHYKTFSAYAKGPEHRKNLENYTNWFKAFRNHPSVVIWSVGNELVTPGCESKGLEKRNKFVDDLAQSYQQHMFRLDPELVVTRDGDLCTYNSTYDNFDPRTPANVHYPEFHKDRFVFDWQRLFEYRPAIYGETLYCSYVWGGGRGARSDIVADKAREVRKDAKLFRDLGVSAPIYMGVGLDGFVELKPDGSGSPWRVSEVPRNAKRKANWRNGMPEDEYPFIKVNYPSVSGKGLHPDYCNNYIAWFGFRAVNWSSEKYPSHVRNAVNDAYRDTLIPQPRLPQDRRGEAILTGLTPNAPLYWRTPEGNLGGVRADADGKAWILLEKAGRCDILHNGKKFSVTLPSRHSYAGKPGFQEICTISIPKQ